MKNVKMAARKSAKPNRTTAGARPAKAEPPQNVAAAENSDPVPVAVGHEEIARLAYSYWQARGFCGGSPEEEWYRAEEELRRRTTTTREAAT